MALYNQVLAAPTIALDVSSRRPDPRVRTSNAPADGREHTIPIKRAILGVLVLGGVETRIEDVTAGAIERRLTLWQL